MSYVKDPRVDDYLDGLQPWQREICAVVRDLVHAADPEVEETISAGSSPTSSSMATSARSLPRRTT